MFLEFTVGENSQILTMSNKKKMFYNKIIFKVHFLHVRFLMFQVPLTF
jgi:hypothetical protein